MCLNDLISGVSLFFTAVCQWDLGPRFTHIQSFHNVFRAVVLWKWAKSCCKFVNLSLFCSVCNWFVVGWELNPGPRLLPAESASGLPTTTTEEVATESTKPLLCYSGFDKNEAFPRVHLPLTHFQDNIVQLKPAGALSCNPIELQQKAWLATTPLLSDSPIHCFPPFFRPSSSFARNMDQDVCALITYFSICLSMLFLSLFQPSAWWDNFYC